MTKIKFIANTIKWFDKVNGNTYHSVNITDTKTGKTIYCEFQYGYGEQYRQTAFTEMLKNKWLKGYTEDNVYSYERENDYPIIWNVTDGLKRECVANGQA